MSAVSSLVSRCASAALPSVFSVAVAYCGARITLLMSSSSSCPVTKCNISPRSHSSFLLGKEYSRVQYLDDPVTGRVSSAIVCTGKHFSGWTGNRGKCRGRGKRNCGTSWGSSLTHTSGNAEVVHSKVAPGVPLCMVHNYGCEAFISCSQRQSPRRDK